MGHRWDVETGIGRPTERDQHCNGVLESLLRHDVARFDAEIDEIHHRRTRVEAIAHLVIGNRGLRGAVGKRHAERLDGAGHGVGCVHAAAGTGAGDGTFFDSL